jgi:murein DD-endopeptidase MepM/ murein hydrolase activator NlpD
VSRSIVSALALLAATGLVGSAGAARVARRPTVSSAAVAIRILVPAGQAAATPAAPLRGGSVSLASFSFPRDGAVVVSGATQAETATSPGTSASAHSSSGVVDLSLFDGEVTADSVDAAASAATAHGRAGGGGSAHVVNLQVLGRKVTHGRVALGAWGSLTVAERTDVTAAPPGVKAFRASLAGLEISLSAAHGGLPAGSEIEIAVAEAAAATAPPPRPPPAPLVAPEALPGDRPQLLPPTSWALLGVPQVISPPLGQGSYVFPVYGPARTSDDFGSLAPGAGYEHGVEIFGQLGEPLVAVATGTLYAVGWSRAGGNRLWLRDREGNEFFYSHLSAFSALATDGARVQAGQVIGFMGDTGNTQGRSTHLEFEVHPVSLLYLGGQGAVDPGAYLPSWRPVASIALTAGPGWAPSVPGTAPAPEPGAALVASSTISSAEGPGASALRRALRPAGRG